MTRAVGPAGELLDARSVVPYLVARGILAGGEPVRVEALGGGVSNVVLAVESGERRLVVKQALARLRVREEWLADPHRAVTEGHALRRAAAAVPDAVPTVVDIDERACALVVDRAPASWTDWKTRLLRGEVDVAVARRLGRIIGTLHASTLADRETEPAFGSWEGFEELRIRPYHRTVAARHAALAPAIDALVERMRNRRRCLVHGDCSPKNVLVGREGLWLIDFEVAHRGDPTFDVAFMHSHLILKALHRPASRRVLRAALTGFLAGYRAAAPGADLLDSPPWLVRQTAALVLARVDGKSPVEYLDERSAALARGLGTRWLADPPARVDALWLDVEATLA
jgi:aminoglycoside phosphotransferase (APT) family kinase protein